MHEQIKILPFWLSWVSSWGYLLYDCVEILKHLCNICRMLSDVFDISDFWRHIFGLFDENVVWWVMEFVKFDWLYDNICWRLADSIC